MHVMGSSINMIDYLPDTTSITNFKMEVLFGAALMDKLHLVQAPLLVQRDLIARISGSNVHQSLESQLHTNLVLTSTHSLKQTKKIENVEASNCSQEERTDKGLGLWVGRYNSFPGGSKCRSMVFGDATVSVHLLSKV
ncbi:hypothetical protein IHE45_01G086400 [Dioscorea alata]|uniref:Uncharacterized protein n=1 Tax=Dioscorea alata TaxID=55571 RepID=A0ACB7WW79_DIOAL|nr:hypothetical protein IHE45_01G086400 [Dioscorea alata]